MASGDFNNLILRKAVAYNPDGSFIKDGYVFTVSSNGKQNWTPDLNLNRMVLSTFTLNSLLYVSTSKFDSTTISSLSVSTTNLSSVTISTLNVASTGYRYMIGSSIVNSSLAGTSAVISAISFSTLRGSTSFTTDATISSLTVSSAFVSTMDNIIITACSFRASTFVFVTTDFQYSVISTLSCINMSNGSTFVGSTMTVVNLSTSVLSFSTLFGSTMTLNHATWNSTMNGSSLVVRSVDYSTLTGSTISTNAIVFQSTTIGSSIIASTLVLHNSLTTSTLVGSTIQMDQMVLQSTATVSTINFTSGTYSTLAGSTLSLNTGFWNSTLIGSTLNFNQGTYSSLTGSTLSLNTGFWNSTLIGSTLNFGQGTYSTLNGSTISANVVSINSSLTGSTMTMTETFYSTMRGSSIVTGAIFASSLTGSTISFINLEFSTLTISTVTANVMYPISMVGSSIRTEMLSASTILTVSTGGKAGIGTNTPNYPLTVSNNAFKTMEVNRIGTDVNNFYASGTVYSITHPTTGFRGEYAYAYAGASTIATTTESQAVGYYAIDVANLGIFGTETANGPSGATFYMDPNKTFFQNTNLGIGTTSPAWLMTAAKDIPIASMTLNPMDAQLVISGKTNTGTLKFGSYYTNTGTPLFGTAIQSSYMTAGYDVGSPITFNPLGGNVGIATTNPSQLLHVMGAIATDAGAPYGLLRFIASNNATFIQSGLSGATGSAAPLYFASMNSGSIWASISATGMMGIGTASSTIPLQVNNNAGTYSTPAASISDGPADLGGTYGMLHLTRPGASSDNKAHISIIRAGSKVFSIGYFSGTDTVGFVSANNMNSSNGMFIMSTGFVGIGTITPQSKFHVYNGVTILSSGTANNNPAYATPTTLHLRGPAATSTQLVWECVNVNTAAITASTGYGLSYGTQGGDHVFRTNCAYNGDFSATGSERFRIAANGNVGINSSTPNYTLEVIGNARISSLLTTPYLSAPDMRSQTNYFKPNHQPSNSFSIGFFGGAAAGTWADGIQLNTYADGSGGNQNLVLFQKNGIGMRIYQGGWQANSSYVSYMDAVMKDSSGNVNIGGGTLTVGSLVVGSGTLIPYGIIVMWYGSAASVPTGWALCNGGSGTPNLMDRFIVAAGSGYGPGATGGESTTYLSVGQLPSHTHSMPDLTHSHTGATYGYANANSGGDCSARIAYGSPNCRWDSQLGIYTNGTTWTATGTATPPGSLGSTGSGWGIENRPLFYALCYIMKI
jgi:hypothetical protein